MAISVWLKEFIIMCLMCDNSEEFNWENNEASYSVISHIY